MSSLGSCGEELPYQLEAAAAAAAILGRHDPAVTRKLALPNT
jgi:hypothetical protein